MVGPSVMWAFSVEGRNLKWLGNAGKPGHFANSARDVLYDYRKIRQNNRLTFQPADSILFLDRIKLHQKQHQCSDGCREEGEQRPDHPVHCVGIGDGHYRLAIDVGS